MILLVYGYDGSGPGHWQRWLADELRARGESVVFPELPDATEPQKDVWVRELQQLRLAADEPITFVCHSLGCWAVDHLLAEFGGDGVRGALLVAPPSPFLLFEPVETFLPPPQRREAWAPLAEYSRLIGSDDDDFTSIEEFRQIADDLGIGFTGLSGAGHINVASGYGPWPLALEWLERTGAIQPR